MAGWSYPMSRQELYAGSLLQTVANALRGKTDDPFQVVWPWPDESEPENVTEEERKHLEARLRASSALTQIRTPEAMPSTTE